MPACLHSGARELTGCAIAALHGCKLLGEETFFLLYGCAVLSRVGPFVVPRQDGRPKSLLTLGFVLRRREYHIGSLSRLGKRWCFKNTSVNRFSLAQLKALLAAGQVRMLTH